MSYMEDRNKLEQYRAQIADLRRKMRETQAAIAPQDVEDYELASPRGSVHLSELFDGEATLIVIHNMGAGCPYCTLWADGFNGVFDHLRSRAAFVMASPDKPDQQQKFASGRGWKFPMVSYQGNTFGEDMGYRPEGRAMPGISVFKRDGERITRVSDTSFSPGDDFCTVWHILDLIPEGPAGWQPKYHYGAAGASEPPVVRTCCG
jgi:predicted dithiol-disulfide oxidoreductase (DUF899 family)